MSHIEFMSRAIALAKKGHYTTSPNPRVGCVLVKDDLVIGEGFHQKAGEGHAEVNALADAKSRGHDATGATAYVTLEPCSHFGRTPPCAVALAKAKIVHVVIAMVDPNPQVSGRGVKMLEQAGITTEVGILEQEARLLNVGFIKLMTSKMPYVRCKLASSLDGKTAMASGESQWITSAQARADVQQLRAQSCAIISGAETVIFDNAKLSVRKEQFNQTLQDEYSAQIRQPVRVIIDSQHRITPDLALFESVGKVVLVSTKARDITDFSAVASASVEQLTVEPNKQTGKVDLQKLLSALASSGLNDIFIEAGATLAGAFIKQELVDEIVLYQAPKLMGHDGKGLVNLPDLTQLKDSPKLVFKDVRMVGPDLKITANLIKKQQ